MEILIYSVIAVLVTGAATFVITNKATARKRNEILTKAEADAEMVRKEKALAAKERFIQLKAEHDKSINDRNNKMAQLEAKIKSEQVQTQKETESLERAKREFETTKNKVEGQLESLSAKREEV
ncbi:MAG: Rnase Y domain-containing protein, partial [Mucinivorans sp.]